MKNYTFRLKSGQDLFEEVGASVKVKNIEAGYILSGAGSLTHFTLRYANQERSAKEEDHFEIVSITGTVSVYGSHLNMSIADEQGKTIGGLQRIGPG